MLDWLLNPYGVPAPAYYLLWVFLAVAFVGSFIYALITVVFHHRKTPSPDEQCDAEPPPPSDQPD